MTFVAVAKHLNVSRASAELEVSQASVSQQLKGLHKEYGAKFYKKNSKGIELTEQGQVFLGYANLILEQVERLDAHFNGSPRAIKQKPLVVGGSHGLSAHFLPSTLATFQKRHSQVRVILQTGPMQSLEQKVLKSEVDIALVRHASSSPHIICERYRHERVVPFVSAKHPLARKGKLTLSELESVPLIIRGINTSSPRADEIVKHLESRGLKPNIVMRCESPETAKVAVLKKMGLGFLYWELLKSDVQNGLFKTIRIPDLNLKFTTFILYHRDKPLSANAQDFLVLLRQRRHKSQIPKLSVQTE